MFISQSILHITFMLFHISKNANTPNHRLYWLHMQSQCRLQDTACRVNVR